MEREVSWCRVEARGAPCISGSRWQPPCVGATRWVHSCPSAPRQRAERIGHRPRLLSVLYRPDVRRWHLQRVFIQCRCGARCSVGRGPLSSGAERQTSGFNFQSEVCSGNVSLSLDSNRFVLKVLFVFGLHVNRSDPEASIQGPVVIKHIQCERFQYHSTTVRLLCYRTFRTTVFSVQIISLYDLITYLSGKEHGATHLSYTTLGQRLCNLWAN